MKKIVFDNPHRRKHFEYFLNLNHPHFNITAQVSVTGLVTSARSQKVSLHLAIVFLLSKIANEIEQFRWRIRGNEIVEHSRVHPSFTVPTDASDVFSFCTVDFDPDPSVFLPRAASMRKKMSTNPDFEDEEGRDDYLFLSAFPWVSFTGYQHAMQLHPHDSVPRISWGKITEESDGYKMPLSVQAHHGLVDGSYVGMFINRFEEQAGSGKLEFANDRNTS